MRKILTVNSKMQVPSFAVHTKNCNVGSGLNDNPNSVCHSKNCYAKNGTFRFPSVVKKLLANMQLLKTPEFVQTLVDEINKTRCRYFRWFDSGDVSNKDEAMKVLFVCMLTPYVKHWIPTKETKHFRNAEKDMRKVHNYDLHNAVIRYSSHLIDQAPIELDGVVNTSTVYTHIDSPALRRKPTDYICRVYDLDDTGERGKSCGTCDACWNPSVSNISYIKRSPHHHISWKKNYDKITKRLDMEVIQ
tara:strand:- start:660 stop:1397 length:738 start_codon:yes stop_codon:yes gene_type:complete